MECQGRENRRQVWKRMKGFHGNFCLPVAKVALQIPQASFPWPLKPASPAAESRTVERLGRSTSGSPQNAPEPLLQAPPPCFRQGPSRVRLYPLACTLHPGASRHLENGQTWPPFRVLVMTCSSVCQAPHTMPAPERGESEGQWSLFSLAVGIRSPGPPLRPAADWRATLRGSLPFCSFAFSLCAMWGCWPISHAPQVP